MSEIDLSSPLNYGTPGSLSSVRTPHSGIRGTPIRMRPDIRTDRRIRQVNVNTDPVCIHVTTTTNTTTTNTNNNNNNSI
jgi:DNA replication licensing factor MCM4